jgi:hypothetical protein
MTNAKIFFCSLTLAVSISIALADDKPNFEHHGPQLTSEQKACLTGKIGEPGSGTRPTREAMDAAFSACGIEKPTVAHPEGRSHETVQQENSEATE